MAAAILTQDRLRELLHYDPDTGIFTWLVNRKRARVGDVAGAVQSKGYVTISINRQGMLAHRLAFLYVDGKPLEAGVQVDHINGNRQDNRWVNLRSVTASVNCQNLRRGHKDGTSGGALGVSYAPHKSKNNPWHAQIGLPIKRRVWLGSFPTKEAAQEAYLAAKRKHHEGCEI